MSVKNKLFTEMFKMSPAAALQDSTKAPSHKLSYWTQPDPIHRSIQPMDNSEARHLYHIRPRYRYSHHSNCCCYY